MNADETAASFGLPPIRAPWLFAMELDVNCLDYSWYVPCGDKRIPEWHPFRPESFHVRHLWYDASLNALELVVHFNSVAERDAWLKDLERSV